MLETPEGPIFESNAIARYGKSMYAMFLFLLGSTYMMEFYNLRVIMQLLN